MNIDPKPSLSPETTSLGAIPSRFRIRNGLSITLIGLLVFLVGARPNIFDLDRSPVVGFVQISVFLIGLATICIGGYICLMAFWQNGDRSIPADIGIRMVTTGYVIAVFCGMADVFGFGTQLRPRVPFFGPWQAFGAHVREAVIAIGLPVLMPYHRTKKALEK